MWKERKATPRGRSLMGSNDPHKAEADFELQDHILRSMTHSVIVCDLQGDILYWNAGAEIDFGYSSEQILGRSLALIYPTAETKQMRRDIEAVLSGHDFSGEWEGLRKDGSRLWMDIHITVVKDAGNRPSKILRVGHDITKKKREREANLHREPLYHAIGEAVDYGVWGCDTKGRLTHMSDSFLKLLGLTRAQNISDGWLNALHPGERDSIMAAWQVCFSEGKPWNRRYRILGADGHYHDILTHAAPIVDKNGEILCWAGLNLDASKLK